MGSIKKTLRIALGVAVVAALSGQAQLNEVVDPFDGPDLESHWGNNPKGEWDGTEGHDAPGCMKITAPSGETVRANLNLSSGRGFPRNPTAISYWYKVDPAIEAVSIQLDLATSTTQGVCGYFNYVGQVRYDPWSFCSDWCQDTDDTIPDLGELNTQYGGTCRSEIIDWIESNDCMSTNYTGTETDTNVISTRLIWRIRVTGGTMWIDDWKQVPVTVGTDEPAAAAAMPTRDLVFSADKGVTFPSETRYSVAVHSPDGRLVSKLNGYGTSASIPRSELTSGSYIVRVTSGLGDVSGRLVID